MYFLRIAGNSLFLYSSTRFPLDWRGRWFCMANELPNKQGIWTKKIPTLVGLLLLVIALVAGTIFFQDGLGVFSPRATPETTPKKVRVTNVTDSTFTVSFITDEPTAGFVKYGTDPNKTDKTQGDERDQLSGTVKEYQTHHINVTGLQPNSTYHYVIGTGKGAVFDNEGKAFSVTTARRAASPGAAKTVYGSVTTESGAPAEGAIVYVAIEGAGELSSQVKPSGSWAIPLSNARKTDKTGYAEVKDDDALQILVQGPESSRTAQGSVIVNEAQPVPTIAYGQSEIKQVATEKSAEEKKLAENPGDGDKATPDPGTKETPDPATKDASSSPTLATASPKAKATTPPIDRFPDDSDKETSDSPEDKLTAAERTLVIEIDGEKTESQEEIPVIKTTQPIIKGTAAAGVIVTIEVNSETQITQQLVANPDGSFSLDIAALSAQLEPGEHTVTYSYIDPTSGEQVTRTQSFIVEGEESGTSTQLAQANAVPTSTPLATATPTPTTTPLSTPFGSTNPYPIGAATQSATQNSSTTTTATSSSTSTSSASSRSSLPSTASGVPVSGSVGTTLALIFGGLFFITSGAWSFWASKQFKD